IVDPFGRRASLPLPTDGNSSGSYAAVAARRDLDAALLGHARALGVAIREHTTLRALARDNTGIEATLEHDGTRETLRTRFLVAADGHYSAVRRLLDRGHAPDLGSWHAARQYFRDVDDTRLWVLFERDLLPGYAWVFPLPGGRANVGFGVLRDCGLSGRELKALWQDLLTRP